MLESMVGLPGSSFSPSSDTGAGGWPLPESSLIKVMKQPAFSITSGASWCARLKIMKTALHWLPRILGIAAILFVSMFALDSFGPGLPLSKQIGNFLIHLIPSYVLLLALVIAWKWELVGGSLFVLLGLGLAPFIFRHNYQMNHSVWVTLFVLLIINAPFVLVGGLFIFNHFRGHGHSA